MDFLLGEVVSTIFPQFAGIEKILTAQLNQLKSSSRRTARDVSWRRA